MSSATGLLLPRFLRASGGVSFFPASSLSPFLFSPRKRRCFSGCAVMVAAEDVFSAQAEVFLFHSRNKQVQRRFLRASGGVSTMVLQPKRN